MLFHIASFATIAKSTMITAGKLRDPSPPPGKVAVTCYHFFYFF